MTLTPQQQDLLHEYAEAVVKAPKHLHLTADREVELFWNRHILDAVKLLETIPSSFIKETIRVIDIGSGNGIPGIPISILRPAWQIDLLDSDNKKSGFIDMFCKSSAIKNVRIIVGRAETLAHGPMRASYDFAFARALSKLRITTELAAAFIRIGGILIVPHGTSWEAELKDSANSLKEVGLEMQDNIEYKLGDVSFRSIVFKKTIETPLKYPRGVGIPEKRPL